MKIGVMFGSPETTTGGHALKFYASVRLEVRRLAPIKVGEEAQGNRTRVKVVKNKMAAPFREVEFDVRYGSGIDSVSEMLELGAFLEVVDKSGSHLSFGGQHLGNGRERARETLLADAALRARLGEALRAAAIARRGQAPAAAQPALGDAE